MRKIIYLLLILSIIFLNGCDSNPIPNQVPNQEPNTSPNEVPNKDQENAFPYEIEILADHLNVPWEMDIARICGEIKY